MAELVRIALDAMGGDNAPAEPVFAAVEALAKSPRAHITLLGQEAIIREHLKNTDFDQERLVIVPATEVIEMAEHPVNAIRKKKDSSIVLALRMLKNGEADAFISAGSTGAVLAGGQLLVGRLPGVERAPLAPLLPTLKGVSLLIDCGANVDARPNHLLQFAKMGSSEDNHIESATFIVQSYADSLYKAAALNEVVKNLMRASITQDAISRCKLNSDYNFTDTKTKRYRYQAVFDITYY